MMPGVGFEEMILLVIVAIVVIGPKDLPLMMRKFGRFTGKMRAMAFEFKQGIDELGRQAELDELRKEVADLKKATGLDEIRRDLQAEAIGMQQDINTVMRETPNMSASARTLMRGFLIQSCMTASRRWCSAPSPTPSSSR